MKAQIKTPQGGDVRVAPRAGARIETRYVSSILALSRGHASPPVRGRGLKHFPPVGYTMNIAKPPSPPVRGRGLKLEPMPGTGVRHLPLVAPRAGARIETVCRRGVPVSTRPLVAPRAGARIETWHAQRYRTRQVDRRPPCGGAD